MRRDIVLICLGKSLIPKEYIMRQRLLNLFICQFPKFALNQRIPCQWAMVQWDVRLWPCGQQANREQAMVLVWCASPGLSSGPGQTPQSTYACELWLGWPHRRTDHRLPSLNCIMSRLACHLLPRHLLPTPSFPLRKHTCKGSTLPESYLKKMEGVYFTHCCGGSHLPPTLPTALRRFTTIYWFLAF